MERYQENKALILSYYQELETANADNVVKVIQKYASPDIHWCGVHPFHEQKGEEAIAETFWRPFLSAWSQVQRRQDILFAGTSEIDNTDWVISMGHFMGLLDSNWLGFPANRKMVFLRYADFNCIRNGKLVRSGFFCDLIGLMHQMGINPLPLQTGASFVYPGPKTHDGLLLDPQDPAGGFLGLPASDTPADMRVVDIYRREGNKLAENWVFIDLPWWLQQQGVDIFKRT